MTLDVGARVLLVGAGKMGGALLSAWLDRGLQPDSITVLDPAPSPETRTLIVRHGLATVRPEPPGIIVLAVKPQAMDEALPSLRGLVRPGTLVISVAAGRTLASLARPLPADTPIVRCMPNTPAAIGRGVTVACANAFVTAKQRERAEALLGSVGAIHWIDDESLMDAVTAVSGSGPAYLFLLAECLAEAGVEAGLPQELAKSLARDTVIGAGALLAQSVLDPSKLRENVTSPGGTTQAALDVLMGDGGLEPLLSRAVKAAADRSRALSS